MKTIEGGPKILVSVKSEKGKVARAQLSLFDCFCLDIPEPHEGIWQWLSLYAQKKQPKPLAFEQAARAQSRSSVEDLSERQWRFDKRNRGELAELYDKKGREAVPSLTEENLLRSNGGVLQLDKPPFTSKILSKLQEIPFGSTTTYQALAQEIGNPKAARAVGNACGSNPFPLFIPCHRVLHTNGGMGGFSCGIEIKRRLLAFERN